MNVQIFIGAAADVFFRKTIGFTLFSVLIFPQILSSFVFHALHINVSLQKIMDERISYHPQKQGFKNTDNQPGK